mmetsp:Transcript_35078/g.79562  ORF Transcript_35078/g.79562 Transcript_35078/m.79562 type:complete len:84 (+) Transcript_35078:536-787(+)
MRTSLGRARCLFLCVWGVGYVLWVWHRAVFDYKQSRINHNPLKKMEYLQHAHQLRLQHASGNGNAKQKSSQSSCDLRFFGTST